MKKLLLALFLIVACVIPVLAQPTDPIFLNPTNLPWAQDPTYQRIDSQWDLHNLGLPSELWHNGVLQSTDPAGDYDISALQAWAIRSVCTKTIAVIDTGVDTNHIDLTNSIIGGRNFSTGNTNTWDLNDTNGHGTVVAGIIAAAHNGIGVAGVCSSAPLYICRISYNFNNEVVDAIYHCISNHIRLINLSWGTQVNYAALSTALDAADAAGMIVVCAPVNANENLDLPLFADYPAFWCKPNVLCVSGVNRQGKRPSSSPYGAKTVSLFAPGWVIPSTLTNSRFGYDDGSSMFGYDNGTSQAAPIVTAALGLVWSEYPNQPPQAIIERVMRNVDTKPWLTNLCVSSGALNLYKALKPEQVTLHAVPTAGGLTIAMEGTYTNSIYQLQHSTNLVDWDTVQERTGNQTFTVTTELAMAGYRLKLK